MKKSMIAIASLLIMLWCGTALAEPLGFGYVNAKDVALRREPNGKIVTRLPEDTCVWIRESRTDKKGELWYNLTAGIHENANYDCLGWMKASFVDAGADVWHDIKDIAASDHGMIALRTDGTTATAGRLIVNKQATSWVSPRRWAEGIDNAIQIGTVEGNGYTLLTADGDLITTIPSTSVDDVKLRLYGGTTILSYLTADNTLRFSPAYDTSVMNWYPAEPDTETLSHVTQIVTGDQQILYLLDNGTVYTLMLPASGHTFGTEAEVTGWTNVNHIEWQYCSLSGPRQWYTKSVAGVRKDGTVIGAPEKLNQIIGQWTDIADVKLAWHYAIGLKQDGTVITAAFDTSENGIPDVSGWTDITAIATGMDYCVGLKSDGTLVFAGDHLFMNEGHTKK